MRAIKNSLGVITVYLSVAETKPTATVALEDGSSSVLRDGDRLLETDGDIYMYNKAIENWVIR